MPRAWSQRRARSIAFSREIRDTRTLSNGRPPWQPVEAFGIEQVEKEVAARSRILGFIAHDPAGDAHQPNVRARLDDATNDRCLVVVFDPVEQDGDAPLQTMSRHLWSLAPAR